ncbi:inhibitor of growth proteins N-terminal histone-binding-domain-containing protein [Aspergillus coremiiformis]|uniref:Chromatin modification-related protein n=1 Tax=Aspergillus coremiiformis TaxID=138285 RepID=A0A5N6YZT6_9EURO|nr:inhibitor of growth proteins N-terminal histone-binding-domain-containing protein [Aspergillus coremiiformis]
MAHGAEDCASVLEQFVHDVANLPAEINHLMEEIQAKDKIIHECRSTINSRDSSLQKFIKMNGSLTPNPKEEQYGRVILQNLDKSQQLQDEKIQLSEKACVLLDRQIKKLDLKIRDLQNDGVLSIDPPLPSLFNNSDQYRDLPRIFFPDSSSESTSYNSPLHPTSGNANVIIGATQRLNQSLARSAGLAALGSPTAARSSAPATPAGGTVHFHHRQRESSAGAVENKRRRLNPSLGTLPAASSNLRQSSLGPGTPKGGTPASSRAGSAGPRSSNTIKKAIIKKVAPHQQLKKIKASSGLNGKSTKRSSSAGGRIKLTTKKSPSTAGGDEDEDDSLLSSADVSDSENNSDARRGDEDMEDEDEDEANEDTKVYCTCRSVSHGDMVACDNEHCEFEWFHWKCVGLTREPVGKWYCPQCTAKLNS